MGPLSKYWEIIRIDPGGKGCGYKIQGLPLASEFFQAQFPELAEVEMPVRSHIPPQQHRYIQAVLHDQFTRHTTPQTTTLDLQSQFKAGLCLRAYVAYAILKACKILANQFQGTGRFSYQDLLPYVLNDDGRIQVILDPETKIQLILKSKDETPKATYPLFSVDVLRTFNPKAHQVVSLDNWTHRQIQQNKEIKDFLAEQGFYKSSDWALLNRAGKGQLDLLSLRECHLIEAFHAIYRRDRRQQQKKRGQLCPAPTPEQLQAMQQHLQTQEIYFNHIGHLETELKQVAQVLRQYAIWHSNGMPPSEFLEAIDPYTNTQKEFCDPNSINTLEQIAQQEFREFCHQQLIQCLDWGIEQGICELTDQLKQRRNYAAFASNVVTILQLAYCQGYSQSKIADTLGMNNQSQVSRVLTPTKLLNQIRRWTVKRFLQILSSKESTLNIETISTDPNYLDNLLHYIEAFVDTEIFQAAVAEIKTAKRCSMNSLYAQRLRQYIELETRKKE